jgi:hypothetical protein
MKGIEDFFDINMVLMALFSSLETIRDEKKIELIYDIDATVPKELKGNAEALSHLLTQILLFVFQNTNQKEIVLYLLAPKDFLYEETISFEIRETDLSKEKVTSFLETQLNKNLELLDGKIIIKDENPSDIHVNIPFKLNKLGDRRYYRLPDMAMLGKKVLLICKSQKVAKSIQKMFKYFLYNVDVGVDEYKRRGSNLTQYDIFIIEDKLTTEEIEKLVEKVQKDTPLKYVILEDSNYDTESINKHIVSTYLIKPVIPESIFELIILLFEHDVKDRSIKSEENKTIVNMENYINEAFKKEKEYFREKSEEHKINHNNLKKSDLHSIKHEKKEIETVILDTKVGEQNTKKVGLSYAKELKKFLDSFDHSDVYFRQIVNEKAIWQIKEFCIELEKKAKTIGAHSMLNLTDQITLLLIYNKLDTLPVYVGKYHIELEKLIREINRYLNSLKI